MDECPLTAFRISHDESGKQSLYPDGDPDRHQNLNICSLARCQPSLKILCKSVRKFLRKVANRQTDKQTNNDELHIRFGGCNKQFKQLEELFRPHTHAHYDEDDVIHDGETLFLDLREIIRVAFECI